MIIRFLSKRAHGVRFTFGVCREFEINTARSLWYAMKYAVLGRTGQVKLPTLKKETA